MQSYSAVEGRFCEYKTGVSEKRGGVFKKLARCKKDPETEDVELNDSEEVTGQLFEYLYAGRVCTSSVEFYNTL